MTDSESSEGRSIDLFTAARQLIPGGVNSPVRAFRAVGGTPPFIDRAEGPYIWDADGNRYVDYVMSWGPLINGHAYPPVVEAIRRQAERGTSFGMPTAAETELSEEIVQAMPSIEMIRLVSTGTEAAMSAIRLARAYTNRDLIVKFAGNYHGHADALLAQAGSGALTLGVPSSPGVPRATVASTIVAQYNDFAELEAIFAELGGEIAAVIVEPVAGNMGVIEPSAGFLPAIRRLTNEHAALCIFDEVITGFRVGHAGAQAIYRIVPDLTILGKIIGGGLPAAAYGGRREIMEMVSPSGPVYQAGTLSGNPLAMAAGLANLAPLGEEDFYQRIDRATRRLALGLQRAARDAGLTVTVNCVTGMLTVFFAPDSVSNLEGAEKSDRDQFAKFFHAMLDRRFYVPPSRFEAWMISAAHTDEIIDHTIAAARDALTSL